jgi:hypothetical protein
MIRICFSMFLNLPLRLTMKASSESSVLGARAKAKQKHLAEHGEVVHPSEAGHSGMISANDPTKGRISRMMFESLQVNHPSPSEPPPMPMDVLPDQPPSPPPTAVPEPSEIPRNVTQPVPEPAEPPRPRPPQEVPPTVPEHEEPPAEPSPGEYHASSSAWTPATDFDPHQCDDAWDDAWDDENWGTWESWGRRTSETWTEWEWTTGRSFSMNAALKESEEVLTGSTSPTNTADSEKKVLWGAGSRCKERAVF